MLDSRFPTGLSARWGILRYSNDIPKYSIDILNNSSGKLSWRTVLRCDPGNLLGELG
jgi:hypothetical protein